MSLLFKLDFLYALCSTQRTPCAKLLVSFCFLLLPGSLDARVVINSDYVVSGTTLLQSLLYSLPVHITLIGSLFRRSNPIGFWLVCISTGGGVDRFTPPTRDLSLVRPSVPFLRRD